MNLLVLILKIIRDCYNSSITFKQENNKYTLSCKLFPGWVKVNDLQHFVQGRLHELITTNTGIFLGLCYITKIWVNRKPHYSY